MSGTFVGDVGERPPLPRMPGQRVKDVITASLGAAADLAARGQPGELENLKTSHQAQAETIRRLEAELVKEKATSKGWKDTLDMYANAWARELIAASSLPNKRHEIDALVVGVRHLASARNLARQEADGYRLAAASLEGELEQVRGLVVAVNNRTRELAGRGIAARLVAWWRGQA